MPPTAEQARVCAKADVAPWDVDPRAIVGLGPLDGVPLNGLRHPPDGETSGWYIWSGGEMSSDPEFFSPVHTEHLAQVVPEAMTYLALPPGWRFQVAPGHEDVWEDSQLLDI